MRFLAIDLGDKRTGLAHGDDESGLVSPGRQIEKPINPGVELLDAIANAVDDYGPDALIIGLPLNMDGTEGPRSRLVRTFAARVAERTKLPIHFQDERLTTASADWTMARSGMTRKQKKLKRDALAAAAILRDYFEAGEKDEGD